MIHSYKRQILATLAATAVLASCVTKKYQQPVVNTDKLYRDTTISDTTSMASMPVSQLFSDTVLVNLIQEGLRENLDLKTAVQRINEAQATFNQSKAAYLPSLEGSGTVTRAKTSAASLNFPPEFANSFNLKTTTYQAALSTSWEADIWGKLSSSKRAALASLLQSDAAKRAVQTQLIADIANAYYNLLALDEQLAITQQTLTIRVKDVETVKALKEGAVVNGAAVVQSEANRYAAEVTIPDLKQSIREAENALSILLARAPGTIKRTTLSEQKPVADLKTGIPSQLLKNRPDVQEAEFAFRSAFENTNLARTYFYPQLTITGQAGLSTLQLKNFLIIPYFTTLLAALPSPFLTKVKTGRV
ncbi:TolC family protein [Mucilaginibacter sp. P25]|uniref:TolC family protein n=1 Tax=Mucilaginibacter sp. P25 TaxID=3423945 RepID=UPI003D7B8FF2